jgi:hypothetical protein
MNVTECKENSRLFGLIVNKFGRFDNLFVGGTTPRTPEKLWGYSEKEYADQTNGVLVAVLAEAADTFLAGIVKNRLIGRLTETLRSQSDGDISPTSSALYIGWIKGSACTSRHIFFKYKEEWKTEKKRKVKRKKGMLHQKNTKGDHTYRVKAI